MFSLMDTDVNALILTVILTGEKISTADADQYLDALDYDQNGVVDFSDILSWVAVMKANYKKHDSSSILSWATLQNGVRVLVRNVTFSKACLWLAFACLLRDILVPKQRKVIKSSSVRLLGTASLLLYMIDLLSGGAAGRERRFSSLLQVFGLIKQRFRSK
ncbi:unnamed protein product [Phytophthora lilii]|uniref:Unnamed protein product n=1 Tax=Phytophthora lilii TaxID=2077276 RepID=A0A9W6WRR3_9STRA|nr:unnamed protein product [Phytophthora lilii]